MLVVLSKSRFCAAECPTTDKTAVGSYLTGCATCENRDGNSEKKTR